MNPRTASWMSTLALLLAGCPNTPKNPDGGPGPGWDSGPGACAAPCGPTEVCDPQNHVCVDGCGGQCPFNTICLRDDGGVFACTTPAQSCGANQCSLGQALCLAGQCSCLPNNLASLDTCWNEGKTCHSPFVPALDAGGQCEYPALYDQCQTTGCAGGPCAACQAGRKCVFGPFGSSIGTCQTPCTSNGDCAVDEFCDGSTRVCFPTSLFLNPDCAKPIAVPPGTDGGFVVTTSTGDGGLAPGTYVIEQVPPSNTCLLASGRDRVSGQNLYVDPLHPVGTCTYAIFNLWGGKSFIPVCRPNGPVAEGGACKRDLSPPAAATQCGTGLECVAPDGVNGVCMRVCNAVTSVPPYPFFPACNAGESCVNLYRVVDRVSVLGVCMHGCDLFDGGTACVSYGATQASCVPTDPQGQTLLTSDGRGVCMPQTPSVAATGAPCVLSDPLKGASCAGPDVCYDNGNGAATCAQPCDLACTGASPPAGCANEANATCPSGKTCTQVVASAGYGVGLCL